MLNYLYKTPHNTTSEIESWCIEFKCHLSTLQKSPITFEQGCIYRRFVFVCTMRLNFSIIFSNLHTNTEKHDPSFPFLYLLSWREESAICKICCLYHNFVGFFCNEFCCLENTTRNFNILCLLPNWQSFERIKGIYTYISLKTVSFSLSWYAKSDSCTKYLCVNWVCIATNSLQFPLFAIPYVNRSLRILPCLPSPSSKKLYITRARYIICKASSQGAN